MNATGVTAGLAESKGKLLLSIWRDSLHVTCGLTAYTPGSAPGPTLGNEYGKLYLYFYPMISKVGGDASHGSHMVVAPMVTLGLGWDTGMQPSAMVVSGKGGEGKCPVVLFRRPLNFTMSGVRTCKYTCYCRSWSIYTCISAKLRRSVYNLRHRHTWNYRTTDCRHYNGSFRRHHPLSAYTQSGPKLSRCRIPAVSYRQKRLKIVCDILKAHCFNLPNCSPKILNKNPP